MDQELEGAMRDMLKARNKIEMEGTSFKNVEISSGNHAKYKGEFYCLIVGLTSGEAKCVVRGINEKGWESDGFLALALLQARFDANTAASLLQCVMEGVNPPTLKNHQGIHKGITEWEVRVDSLKMKHDESISASTKISICVGMLPKE